MATHSAAIVTALENGRIQKAVNFQVPFSNLLPSRGGAVWPVQSWLTDVLLSISERGSIQIEGCKCGQATVANLMSAWIAFGHRPQEPEPEYVCLVLSSVRL